MQDLLPNALRGAAKALCTVIIFARALCSSMARGLKGRLAVSYGMARTLPTGLFGVTSHTPLIPPDVSIEAKQARGAQGSVPVHDCKRRCPFSI